MRDPRTRLGVRLKRFMGRGYRYVTQLNRPRRLTATTQVEGVPRRLNLSGVSLDPPPVTKADVVLLTLRTPRIGLMEIDGFCRTGEGGVPGEGRIVYAKLASEGGGLTGSVSPGPRSPLPNLISGDAPHSLADSVYRLTFDGLDQLRSASYVVQVGIELEHMCVLAHFSHRYERGSAGALGASPLGPGRLLRPSWRSMGGLHATIAGGKVVLVDDGVGFSGDECMLRVLLPAGFEPVRARWSRGHLGPAPRVRMEPGHDAVATVTFDAGTLTATKFAGKPVGLELIDSRGSVRLIHQGPEMRVPRWLTPRANLAIAADRNGVVRFTPVLPRCEVDTVDVEDNGRVVVLQGNYEGDGPHTVTLNASRTSIAGHLETLDAHRFICRVPLYAIGWLGQDRVVASALYGVEANYADGTTSHVTCARTLEQDLPVNHLAPLAHLRVERGARGQLCIDIAPPLDGAEVGEPGLKSVVAARKLKRKPIVADALYLESWFGKSFSDNPAPLAEALRGDFGQIFVGVADNSVEIPEFVTPVIMGSSQWWDVATSSRVVVNNSWIPSYFKRRTGQKVIQTWHGTPLKKLGFDRSQHEGRASTPKSFAWGSAKWDVLVSPNAYSTEILRRAYTYDGHIAEIGYPRNDVLVAGDGVRARVRATLGISPGETVVVYAPTFREGAYHRSTFCDVEALARDLGVGYRLVVRGHSATLRSGSDHQGAGVLDVTSYPESSHILAIADVLVTDYSSVMFDFTATGKPLVFFTPDIELYSRDGRGVYFDLNEHAPGAVVKSERALADAVRHASERKIAQPEKYDAWVKRFNTHDDGGATERLARMVREWL